MDVVRLQPITRKNLDAVLALRADESQAGFVSTVADMMEGNTMIKLVPVTEDNWMEIAGLAVKEHQRGFVAPAIGILARGYEADKLPRAELLVANLLIEYIGYERFQRAVAQAAPLFVSCIIQINTDEAQWVSDSPYLHAFDRLDEIHHRICEDGLNGCMEQMRFGLLKRVETVLPNGKKLIRLDYGR